MPEHLEPEINNLTLENSSFGETTSFPGHDLESSNRHGNLVTSQEKIKEKDKKRKAKAPLMKSIKVNTNQTFSGKYQKLLEESIGTFNFEVSPF